MFIAPGITVKLRGDPYTITPSVPDRVTFSTPFLSPIGPQYVRLTFLNGVSGLDTVKLVIVFPLIVNVKFADRLGSKSTTTPY
jgi:hypothetical protein